MTFGRRPSASYYSAALDNYPPPLSRSPTPPILADVNAAATTTDSLQNNNETVQSHQQTLMHRIYASDMLSTSALDLATPDDTSNPYDYDPEVEGIYGTKPAAGSPISANHLHFDPIYPPVSWTQYPIEHGLSAGNEDWGAAGSDRGSWSYSGPQWDEWRAAAHNFDGVAVAEQTTVDSQTWDEGKYWKRTGPLSSEELLDQLATFQHSGDDIPSNRTQWHDSKTQQKTPPQSARRNRSNLAVIVESPESPNRRPLHSPKRTGTVGDMDAAASTDKNTGTCSPSRTPTSPSRNVLQNDANRNTPSPSNQNRRSVGSTASGRSSPFSIRSARDSLELERPVLANRRSKSRTADPADVPIPVAAAAAELGGTGVSKMPVEFAIFGEQHPFDAMVPVPSPAPPLPSPYEQVVRLRRFNSDSSIKKSLGEIYPGKRGSFLKRRSTTSMEDYVDTLRRQQRHESLTPSETLTSSTFSETASQHHLFSPLLEEDSLLKSPALSAEADEVSINSSIDDWLGLQNTIGYGVAVPKLPLPPNLADDGDINTLRREMKRLSMAVNDWKSGLYGRSQLPVPPNASFPMDMWAIFEDPEKLSEMQRELARNPSISSSTTGQSLAGTLSSVVRDYQMGVERLSYPLLDLQRATFRPITRRRSVIEVVTDRQPPTVARSAVLDRLARPMGRVYGRTRNKGDVIPIPDKDLLKVYATKVARLADPIFDNQRAQMKPPRQRRHSGGAGKGGAFASAIGSGAGTGSQSAKSRGRGRPLSAPTKNDVENDFDDLADLFDRIPPRMEDQRVELKVGQKSATTNADTVVGVGSGDKEAAESNLEPLEDERNNVVSRPGGSEGMIVSRDEPKYYTSPEPRPSFSQAEIALEMIERDKGRESAASSCDVVSDARKLAGEDSGLEEDGIAQSSESCAPRDQDDDQRTIISASVDDASFYEDAPSSPWVDTPVLASPPDSLVAPTTIITTRDPKRDSQITIRPPKMDTTPSQLSDGSVTTTSSSDNTTTTTHSAADSATSTLTTTAPSHSHISDLLFGAVTTRPRGTTIDSSTESISTLAPAIERLSKVLPCDYVPGQPLQNSVPGVSYGIVQQQDGKGVRGDGFFKKVLKKVRRKESRVSLGGGKERDSELRDGAAAGVQGSETGGGEATGGEEVM
ncbi:hypothetical protein HK104_009151 [Borealophlyctis nickersoniae]|nr:hypothetical protein HK104_009151 [Borealophlyctis nickersoniae]